MASLYAAFVTLVSNKGKHGRRLCTRCRLLRVAFPCAFPPLQGMWDVVMSVEQFCQGHVEPMSEESDHIHIVAITDALQVPVRVLYLDSSSGVPQTDGASGSGGGTYSQHDFIPEALKAARGTAIEPRVHVLYRPGHYDIVYPKSRLHALQ